MISAGFDPKAKCGALTDPAAKQCTNAFTALKDACVEKFQLDGETKQTECVSTYVSADTLPPYKPDDDILNHPSVGLVGDPKTLYDKMKAMKATGQWPADAAGPTPPEPPPPDKPVEDKEKEKEKEEEETTPLTNYWVAALGQFNLVGGEYSFSNMNPGQENVGVGLIGAQFDIFITPFEIANGCMFGFNLEGGLMNQKDQTHPGTTMVDPMPIIGYFGGGLTGMFNVWKGLVLNPSVDFLAMSTSKIVMGSEGTKASDDTENSLLAPGFGVNFNLMYMVTSAFGLYAGGGVKYFATSGRTNWEDKPNNLSLVAGYGGVGVAVAIGTPASSETKDKDKEKADKAGSAAEAGTSPAAEEPPAAAPTPAPTAPPAAGGTQ